MQLTELFKARRSHRQFSKVPVDRTHLRELIEAANAAPVSCNLQLTQFIAIDDPELLRKLREEVSYKFGYAPTCVVVLYDPRFTVEHQSAVLTAGMAVENLILRATELGLGTCPMAGFTKDNVIKNILHVPDHLELLLLVAVGYSEDTPRPVTKIPLEKTFRFNTFDGLEQGTLNGSSHVRDYTPADLTEYRSRIAPVYLERFHLHTYNDSYYQDAYTVFDREIMSTAPQDVLDLMSYDGMFLKLIRERYSSLSLMASDYVKNNLDFFSLQFNVKTSLISDQNTLQAPLHSGAISFVFQLDFTPNVAELIAHAADTLREGGFFFVATVEETWYRKLRNLLRIITRRLRGKLVNVYEGNPFYRVGPYSPVPSKKLDDYMDAASCTHYKSGTAASYPASGVRVLYKVYRKQSRSH